MAIVVVDFDGTLALGFNSAIKDKPSNTKLIEHINYLKSKGNYIKVVTARGAYSNTLEQRTLKYYDIIKAYLDTNNVQFDELSFNKEYADIYIDDLSILPHELETTQDMSSDFTKNIVTRINDVVIKSGLTTKDEYLWYSAYENKEDIPEILNITSHSIFYRYIFVDNRLTINPDRVFEKIESYKEYPRLNDLGFGTYILNIDKHLKGNDITGSKKLIELLMPLNINPTFSHGDLSIKNILPVHGGLKLIDPLYSSEKFGSYIIDYAKLLFSIKFYDGNIELFNSLKAKINIDCIDILIAAECVRVASYKKQFNFIAENLINEL